MYTAYKKGTYCPAYWQKHKSSRVAFLFWVLAAGILSMAFPTNAATAATYYVDDANGNDSNPGTSALPWKSLNRTYTWYSGDGPQVQEGDTVLFKDGSYGTFKESREDYYLRHFHRTDWVTYKAATGHSPSFSSIYVNNNDTDGTSGESYLKFDGFVIDAGAVFYAANYIYISNCNITAPATAYEGVYAPYYAVGAGALSFSDSSSSATVIGNTLYGGYRGLGITRSNGHTIQNNIIYGFSEDGIGIGGDDLTIEGNHIYDCNSYRTAVDVYGTKTGTFTVGEVVIQAGTGAEGIWSSWQSSYGQIFQTTTTRFTTGGGTITGQNSGATLTSITKVDPTHTDGIQIGGDNQIDIVIRNNVIHDIPYQGIKLTAANDTGSGNRGNVGLILENNLIYDCSTSFTVNGYEDVNINNNTVIGAYGGIFGRFADTVIAYMYNNVMETTTFYSNATFTNHGNNIFGDNPNGTGDPAYPFNLNATEAITGTINAIFNDAANNDYTLVSGSVAIDFGDPAYAPATDILGVSRVFPPDAGCYEYVSDPNNQAPVLQAIGNKSVNENSALTFDVNAIDPDGDPITYSVQNRPSGATFVGQTFSWTPDYNQAGTYQARFIATDEHGAQDFEDITITVNNVNRATDILLIPNTLTKNEGETITTTEIELAQDPDGDTLTYTYSDWLTSLPYTTTYDDAGTHTLHVDVSDGTDTTGKDITITVKNVNRAPVLSAIGNRSAYVSEPLGFTVSATDPDGDAITHSVPNLPTGANFDPSTRSFTWMPDNSQVGSHVVTFIASDGELDDSEEVTITVNTADTTAPNVSNVSPDVNSIQAPLNTLIALDIEDAGKGVDADTVTIKVNNNTIYTGDTAKYSSAYGDCYRTGTNADYRFIYQSEQNFDYDQTINITVNATDLAGNAMAEYSYSFKTEMRSFGDNLKVNSNTLSSNGMPVTVRDSSGNVWTAWHTGTTGSRDIYISKLTAEAENFGSSIKVSNNSADQCNPVIAIGSDDKLYVAWQDNRRGNWDIYLSTSNDGTNWSAETRVTDSNDNQINPAIVVNSSNNTYIVWQDDRHSNQDIYVATSNNGFVTKMVSQITSDTSNQSEPAIAADSANTIYVVWTDTRNSKNDIYGAASNNGPWTNIPIVNTEDSQSSPAIATEAVGSILHLVWVDDRPGDDDIYYAQTGGGLPTSPLTGSSIIDDSTGADQKLPVIAVTGSTGNNLQVFACWQDEREADDDLYLVEISSGSGTNVFVGDNSTNTDQTEPAIGIDGDGHPYLVWTDSRNTNTDIYYAGSTFVESTALASNNISTSSTVTVGTTWNAINSKDDVSVVVPAGAYPCDIEITISKITNPLAFAMQCLGAYDFGPSGIEFSQPVTVTIPYNATESATVAYWYNSLTDALSQQGITDLETIAVSPTLHALQFKTTHFTPFYVFLVSAGGAAASGGGGGGGGGCSMSPDSQANIVELLLPYIGLTAAMVVLKLRDRRKRKARNITKSEC